MVTVSLLQRLEEDAGKPAGAGPPSETAVIESVLTNLRLVLNSASGCCETRLDYGLSDFGALGLSHREASARLSRNIEQQIGRFEPRLRNVVVRPVDDPAHPTEFQFHIEAELVREKGSVRVAIESVLGWDGHLSLRL